MMNIKNGNRISALLGFLLILITIFYLTATLMHFIQSDLLPSSTEETACEVNMDYNGDEEDDYFEFDEDGW